MHFDDRTANEFPAAQTYKHDRGSGSFCTYLGTYAHTCMDMYQFILLGNLNLEKNI
jgi:hypothetical protein